MTTPRDVIAPGRALGCPRAAGTRASGRLLAALTVAGFVVYLAMNYPALWNVGHGLPERGAVRSLLMLGYIGVGYVALLALLLSIGRAGTLFLSLAIGASVLANFVYCWIFRNSLLSSETVEWLIAEHREAPQAFREFTPVFLAALSVTLLALASLILVGRTIRRTSVLAASLGRGRFAVAPALAFLAVHGVPLVRPVPFALSETNLYAFGLLTVLETAPAPRDPGVLPERPALVDKLVLVVDESVTYAAYSKAVAPALANLPTLDYGAAASFSNCSVQSNVLLRWGVERPSVGKAGYDPRATPHLWGYARAAGFRTVLIDGQSRGFPQNLVNPGEMRQLDEFVPASRGVDSDHLVAELVNERLLRPGRELIYVVKRGAHFPYAEACRPGAVSSQAPKPVQHLAAVRCSTEGFFEQLTRTVDLSRVLLVYTSDHGQDFETRSTHCNPQGSREEFAVPLVVITGASAVDELLWPALPMMRGHASHSQIFPTLLHAMGYERRWAESLYGATLAGPPAPYLTLGIERPYPFQRETVVRFSVSETFPGRVGAGEQAALPEGDDETSRIARRQDGG